MLALELLEYIKGNMEGVGTVSVPFHINQLIEAITELEQLQAELALLQEQLDAVKSDNIRLKSTNETLKVHLAKIEKDNKGLRVKRKRLKEKITDLYTEYAKLKAGLINIRKSTEIMEARRFAEAALKDKDVKEPMSKEK